MALAGGCCAAVPVAEGRREALVMEEVSKRDHGWCLPLLPYTGSTRHHLPGHKQASASPRGGCSLCRCLALLLPPPSTQPLAVRVPPQQRYRRSRGSRMQAGTPQTTLNPASKGCLGSQPTGRNNIRDAPSCFRFYFRIYKIPVSSILMSLFTCLHIVSKFQS